MVVSICHWWSNYCWLGHLKDKEAAGVRDFLEKEVFEDIDKIRNSWADTILESNANAQGGPTELPRK